MALTSNNLNQITSIGGTPLGYDLNGNLLNDGTHIYTHDAVNRLISVDGTITYAYDVLGRRVSKTVNGTITKYVYDGARVIAEYDGAGQLLRKYIYGPGLDEPVLMQTGGYPVLLPLRLPGVGDRADRRFRGLCKRHSMARYLCQA